MPEQSPIEKSFWETAKPLIPELEQETWIDNYRVDFLIPSKKIIIELYGYQYHNTKQKITKDAERERKLQKLGYQIIRFTGTEIYKDVKKCVNEVLELGKIETEKPVTTKKIPNYSKSTKAIRTIKISRKNRLNNAQIAIISIMSIIAICLSCNAIQIVLKNVLLK